jgi:hypothetical protein
LGIYELEEHGNRKGSYSDGFLTIILDADNIINLLKYARYDDDDDE